MSNFLNSPFALLLCFLLPPHPPPPPPQKKNCINCVFHFSWVFQSRTVNVFQALYQTSQTTKMNIENLLGFRTRFLKTHLHPFQSPSRFSNRALFLGEIKCICSQERLFLKLPVLRKNVLGSRKCCWEKDNSGCLRVFDVKNNCYVLCVRNLPPPLRPHPNWPAMFGQIRLVGNFPASQVVGCTLLAGNSSISLAGSKEQIHFPQQSSKMLLKNGFRKLYSCCCWFTPFSQNFPLGAPVFCVCCVIHTFFSCYDRLFSCFFQFGGDSHSLNFV